MFNEADNKLIKRLAIISISVIHICSEHYKFRRRDNKCMHKKLHLT